MRVEAVEVADQGQRVLTVDDVDVVIQELHLHFAVLKCHSSQLACLNLVYHLQLVEVVEVVVTNRADQPLLGASIRKRLVAVELQQCCMQHVLLSRHGAWDALLH